MENKNSGVVLNISVDGMPHQGNIFDISSRGSVGISLPKEFTDEYVRLATNDCSILAKILKEHPEDIRKIFTAIGSGKLDEAKEAAAKIGFNEDNISKQGGGLWALVIVIAVGCALLLAHD